MLLCPGEGGEDLPKPAPLRLPGWKKPALQPRPWSLALEWQSLLIAFASGSSSAAAISQQQDTDLGLRDSLVHHKCPPLDWRPEAKSSPSRPCSQAEDQATGTEQEQPCQPLSAANSRACASPFTP